MTASDELMDRTRRIEEALVHPEQREPAMTRGPVLLRISARASRGPTSYAWAAVGHPRTSPILVREVRVDHRDIADPQVRDAEVKPSVIYRRIKAAPAIPILLLEGNAGCDGATFTVSMQHGSNTSAEIRFWANGPEPWRGFAAWTLETMAALHACVAPGEPLGIGL